MKNFQLKRYLESKTRIKDRKYPFNHENQLIISYFESLTSILEEENLYIILLDRFLNILSLFSPQEIDSDYLSKRQYALDRYLMENEYMTEDMDGFQIEVLYQSIEEDKDAFLYHIIFLSLDKNKERIAVLSKKIGLAIYDLYKKHKKEFQDYENLLLLLDSMDEGVSACDKDGQVTYINKSGTNIFKSPKEEIIGKDLSQLVNNSILVKVVNTKESYLDIEYFIDYKGETVHLLSSAYPVFDDKKNIIGAVDVYKRIKRSFKSATDLVGYKAIYSFENFIWKSPIMGETISIAKRFSNSTKNVLIIGESGTGKELFAQALHNYSIRSNGPFVAINCASYPKDLFESELFGYEEGAFTGAKKGGKAGKFELADGGTLFLDEIGEMPLHLQAKLLRIIETKSISRIGSNKNTIINVRIIAATNRNLEDMVKNNSFREDLYYRLKVLYLHLPPLRERNDDSILLANYFIDKFTVDSTKNIRGLDDEAKEYFRSYDWPGNIRELENIITLSLFYCESDYITKDNLINAGLKHVTDEIPENILGVQKLSSLTDEIIISTLNKNKGNKKKTAEELGISRNTIYRLINRI